MSSCDCNLIYLISKDQSNDSPDFNLLNRSNSTRYMDTKISWCQKPALPQISVQMSVSFLFFSCSDQPSKFSRESFFFSKLNLAFPVLLRFTDERHLEVGNLKRRERWRENKFKPAPNLEEDRNAN